MPFLLDPDVTYLNHGSFGATPRPVRDAQDRWRRELEREPVDLLVRRLPALLTAARAELAPLLGADAEGLVFTTNATSGIQAVLDATALGPGDEVLTTNHRYDAVRHSMDRRVRRTGARVVEAPLPFPSIDEATTVAAIEQALTPATRLLIIDQITSPTALVLPVAAIMAAARRRGVPVLVDAAHAPGHIPVNLGALEPDYWVGNLHKWLFAPKGAALLWVAQSHRARVHAPITSHGWGQGLHAEFDWPGTFDPSAWLAAVDGARFHATSGGPQLAEDNRTLAAQARSLLVRRLGLSVAAVPAEMASAMFTLPLERVPASRALDLWNTMFSEHRIEVPVLPWRGATWVRPSAMSLYNSIDQYDRLADALLMTMPRFAT
jgi:isopenicillin-N epimerase